MDKNHILENAISCSYGNIQGKEMFCIPDQKKTLLIVTPLFVESVIMTSNVCTLLKNRFRFTFYESDLGFDPDPDPLGTMVGHS